MCSIKRPHSIQWLVYLRRAEAMRRVIFVVIRQRIPLGIEVFVNAIMIISGDVVDNHGSHANRAIQPFFVVSDVINNQESFHRVHIGIAAAVLFGFAEGFVPDSVHICSSSLQKYFSIISMV